MAENNWKSYELFLLPLKEVHAGASDIGLDYLNYQKFDKNYTNIILHYRFNCSCDCMYQFYESFNSPFR